MAQRLAVRHARHLNEFRLFHRRGTGRRQPLAGDGSQRAGRQLAQASPGVRGAASGQERARSRRVPAFQFEDHKPVKAVGAVLEAFGERKAPWKLALWFTSNNGWLEGSRRPVDLLGVGP